MHPENSNNKRYYYQVLLKCTTIGISAAVVLGISSTMVSIMSQVSQAFAETRDENGNICIPVKATAVSSDTASLLKQELTRSIPELGIVASVLQEAGDLCSRLCDLCDRTGDVDSCDFCRRHCSEITARTPINP